MILTNAQLIGPDGITAGWLEVDAGRIVGAGPGPADGVDLGGRYLAPGFVDLHVHGGGGASFVDDPRAAVAFHQRHGTTTLLASLVTAPIPELADQITALAPLVADGTIGGVHLEGPFLAAARCGAHDPALLRAPTRADVAALLDAGPVRMVTIAPELPGAVEAIRQVVDGGAVAAIGHTDATYDEARAGLAAGARVGTHLYNAMRPLHHREPGVITALLDSDVTLELVVDNVHIHPALVSWTIRVAAAGRIALITDAIAAAGVGDGAYRLGGLDVTVLDGVARLTQGGSIAGSTLTLDAALRHTVASGVPLVDAVAALTSVPAQALGLDAGTLSVGAAADLVVLSPSLEVDGVMARGEWISDPSG
ncbi:MAG TPA: N-acetylglucosamine-6-phosphate deacetylase [Jatrophihabitantaceae bacterium]